MTLNSNNKLLFKSGEQKGTLRNGIFPSRLISTFNPENMAGTVSDDPSMSRMTNGVLVNGSPCLINGTDSELEGYNRHGQFGHSAIQLHHQNSVMNVTNEPNENGKYNLKYYFLADLLVINTSIYNNKKYNI